MAEIWSECRLTPVSGEIVVIGFMSVSLFWIGVLFECGSGIFGF